MERINAYSRPSSDGGVTVDVEGMAVDLITIMKASGADKESVIIFIMEIFDNVEVKIKTPDKVKN